MTVAANDLDGIGMPGRGWDMTVLELAIFMCVLRAQRPPRLEEVCEGAEAWFECAVDPPAASPPVCHMLSRGWLAEESNRFRATEEGRRVARLLMHGIIRMLDQGTRLLDVALMMTVLRLTKGELDRDVRDD